MASRYQEHKARRDQWEPQAVEVFGPQSGAVLDILELTDWAWHAVYRDESPSQRIIDCIFVCSRGDLAMFALAAREAVTDYRNVIVWADQIRAADKSSAAE